MIPAEIVYKKGKKYLTTEAKLFSLLSFKPQEGKIILDRKPLTKDDIKKIQKLHSEGSFKPHTIRINQTVPFAPLLFLGVLLTIIFQGNMIIFFLRG